MQTTNLAQEFVSQEPIYDWVRYIDPPDLKTPPDLSQINIQWLLIDRQENIELNTYYFRCISKILDPLGVQELSNLLVSFDPVYEKIVFHHIFILRHGQRIDKFQLNKVRIIQREQKIESGIYEGKYEAALFLEDIRADDILEYAYSKIGDHPLMPGKYISNFPLQYSTKIDYLHHRILLKDQSLWVQHHPKDWEKYLSRTEGDWTWTLAPSPHFLFEPQQPTHPLPYAWVEISQYSSWKELAEWAIPFYQLEAPKDSKLTSLIEQWERESSSVEEKILKALRFVQNEIRYLGLEMGIHSCQPAAPEEVFNQRFGDCKGKSQLLRYLLEQMGVRSYPCFVSTYHLHHVHHLLPRPTVFNHVIVCIEFDKQLQFVDPTIIYQGGTLANTMCPPYGYGLILSEETSTLTLIPDSISIIKDTEITNSFDFSGEHVRMTVHTSFYGKEADRMRYTVRKQGFSELAKTYEQYYCSLFGPLEMDPLQIQDNEEDNKVIFLENYRLLNFGTPISKREKKVILYPTSLSGYLNRSIDINRKRPLCLTHPLRIVEKIQISECKYKISKQEIRHPAFSFSIFLSKKNEITYQLITHLDTLQPEQLKEYAEKINEAWDSCQLVFTTKAVKQKSQFKWWLIVWFFLSLLRLIAHS